MNDLIDQFSAYGNWRVEGEASIGRLRAWLTRNEVGDAQTDLRLRQVLDRMHEDRLTIAFVAEFSRGKSELINAVFFSGYGRRILPSSAGRTTMCPTELCWEEGATPQIRLLPIESRREAEVAVLRSRPEAWQVEALDAGSAESLQHGLSRVGETMHVSVEEARELGFRVGESGGEDVLVADADGMVEISRWRHAIIQFPHPLLQQGLVVLDTPGLNAIGAEPELTLSMLPNAHAVVFVLAADTGVTQSDLAVWRECVSAGRSNHRGCMVVLNKIDGLWDGLRDDARIESEIEGQVESVARTLGVPPSVVFPVSAQKGLVGRIQGDAALVERSRLGAFERALSAEVLPARQRIIRENSLSEVDDVVCQSRRLLLARLDGVREQLRELGDLRGKNQSVIEYMMRKVGTEKAEFEEGLKKYYAVRSVFTTLTNNLLQHMGLDVLRHETRRTREAMLESTFTAGLREAMEAFFTRLRGNLAQSDAEIAEISSMLASMYKRFSVEHGLKLTQPAGFSTRRYLRELDRLEEIFNRQINTTLTLVTTEKHKLTQKFFETVAVQARRTFEIANRDVDQWLRAVMAPLETQVREYQIQLKRRLESIKRIHQATDTLEDRVDELRHAEDGLQAQLAELEEMLADVCTALGAVQPDGEVARAA
ncbi:MAG: dynamin family protein [Zoogloeaceae bacterium]|nr:dynamin family protein [Zoogloeaceae bacterium]